VSIRSTQQLTLPPLSMIAVHVRSPCLPGMHYSIVLSFNTALRQHRVVFSDNLMSKSSHPARLQFNVPDTVAFPVVVKLSIYSYALFHDSR
jgi:hypothetical protein